MKDDDDLTMKDLADAYRNLQASKEKSVVLGARPRAARVVCSANNGTHISNPGRVMNQIYIVDTGTYQNNMQQIASMRDAGLALAALRQQLLYGQDLELASPATRIRYHDKIELYEESRRLNSIARQRAHMADEMAKRAKEAAELAEASADARNAPSEPSEEGN